MSEMGMDAAAEPGVGVAYAGFGPRLLALIIDGIILGVIGGVVGLIFGGDMSGLNPVANIISLVVSAAYFIYFFSQSGQTLGGRVTGVKVVDANGGLLSVGRAAVRWIVAYVSAIVIFVGYLWMLWDSRKQTWHDKAAGSIVIKT
jgi:uncharacterized RDD family membrane protein YckC